MREIVVGEEKYAGRKEERLRSFLRRFSSCAVAFSGGVDSSYLLAVCSEVVPRVVAVTVHSPLMPGRDFEDAKRLAEKLGVEHVVVESLPPRRVVENPVDRCYHCKSHEFSLIKRVAEERGLEVVFDGSTAGDRGDYRPGIRALREHGVLSPLMVAGFFKEDIRAMLKKRGLWLWNKPPSACLASRIPWGTPLDYDVLEKVDKTEDFLREVGFSFVRARYENGGLRVEIGDDVNPGEAVERIRDVYETLLSMGWRWVAVDVSGYMPSGKRSLLGVREGGGGGVEKTERGGV